MPSKGNSETHNDSVHASINAETPTEQPDNAASDETSAVSNKGTSTKKTIDFSKLFADDPERNQKISITAIRILMFIACILYFEIRASIIHLEEVQKLIKAPENTPSEILETINDIRNTFSLLGLILIILMIAFASCFTKIIMDFLNKYPQRVFVVTVSLGGVLAFSLPQYLYSFKFIGETKDITTSLLTVTGGILAVFTLLKTHQKNETDEKKFEYEKIVHDEQKQAREDDVKAQKRQFNRTIKQESYKFYKERVRQVHAERRSRYAKAIEQLAADKGAIRLGGVYSLVGLVDEWLDDNDITEEIRVKEGQVIINNLCSYIRSPFPLASKAKEFEGDTVPASYDEVAFVDHQVIFYEEQDVRRTIFIEMSKRSSNQKKDEEKSFESGTWSKFDFDFSRAPIFYPLNTLIIEKGIFTSAKFYGNAEFTEVVFTQNADFSGATFMQEASFKGATFKKEASFKDATFTQEASFKDATFTQEASFKDATFTQNVFFNGATFTQNVFFNGATFTQNVFFNGATFTQDTYFLDATFTLIADFTKAIFAQNVYSSWVAFPKQVYFVEATFTQDVYFVGATFSQNASFNGAAFIQKADFSGTTFAQEAFFFGATFIQNADFNGATFTQNADFNGATFTQKADFSVTTFAQKAEFRGATFTKEANFSDATFTEEVNFSKATFAETAIFHKTTFTRAANFSGAEFTKLEPSFVLKKRKAQFSAAANPQDYDFSVAPVGKSINRGHATLLGEPFEIPLGTVLFDPMSPKYKDGNYSGLSEPAKKNRRV